MRTYRRMFVAVAVLFASACSSTVPCEMWTSMNWVMPARQTKRVCTQDEAGTAHVSVLSVAPWEEYIDALQPTFKMTSDDAVQEAIAGTGVLDESILRAFSGMLKAAGPTLGTDGQKTPGDASKASPPELGDVPKASENATFAPTAPSVEIEPMMRHSAATALFQEVQLLNRYVRDAAVATGLVPYVVRMQVTLLPNARKEPYDAYATITFFAGNNAAAQAYESAEGLWARAIKPIPDTDEAIDQLPRVLPLLVTDDLESTRHSEAAERIRVLAAAAQFMSGNAQIGAGVQSKADNLAKALSNDFNSLLTVTRQSENSVRARLGAVRSGQHYQMVPRTHNVTFLVMVPTRTNVVSYVSTTTLRDAELGSRLPARSPPREQRKVAELKESWSKEWKLPKPNDTPDLYDFLFYEVEAYDYAGFRQTVQKLTKPMYGTQLPIAQSIADHIWTDIENYNATGSYSKGRFSLPTRTPEMFTAADALLDDAETAKVRVRGGRNLDESRLRAFLAVRTSKGLVRLQPTSITITSGRDEATLSFPSLTKTLNLSDPAPILTVSYARSPYEWLNGRQQPLETPLAFVVAERADQPSPVKFQMQAAAPFMRTEKGVGSFQLLIARHEDFTGKIFFSITGADVTQVPNTVTFDHGFRSFAGDGAIDITVRNASVRNDIVVTAWRMEGKKKVPVDDVRIRVLE